MASKPSKPDQWAVVPQLTAAPDLWRDCVALFPCWSVKDVDPLTGQFNNQSGASLILGPGGGAINLEGSDWIEASKIIPSLSLPCTMMFHGAIRATGTFNALFIAGDWDETRKDNDYSGINMQKNSADTTISFNVGDGSPPNSNSRRSFSFPGNLILDTFTTYSGSVVDFDNANMFVNGELFSDTPSVSGTASVMESPLYPASLGGTGGSHDFGIAAIWRRELSTSEHKLLGQDPYIMIRPIGF